MRKVNVLGSVLVLVVGSLICLGVSTVSAQQSTITQRIEQLKIDTRATVSSGESIAIASKCRSVQTVLKSHYDKALRVRVLRGQLYNQQLAKLATLAENLEKKDSNTKDLRSSTTQLDSTIEAFKQKQNEYIELLLDGQNFDCIKDTQGFKAYIITLKAKQLQVVQSSLAIKTFISSRMNAVAKELTTKAQR